MSEVGRPIGVAIIVARDEKLLMGKRKGGYKPGTMGVPGGRIEKGESIPDAVIRELDEETGIIPREFEFIGVVRNDQRESVFTHFVYVCKRFDGEPQNIEPEMCEGWEWYSFYNLPKNILPGHEAAIQMYLDGAKFKDLY